MAQDELDSYISSTDSGPDVLGYWHGKEDIRHKFSMCARWILSTPATSTSSERVFLWLDELWTTADHSSIQKLLTMCCLCTACQNSANNRVDVGRQQCSTLQLTLEIADAIQTLQTRLYCTVSVYFSEILYSVAVIIKYSKVGAKKMT